MNITEQHNFQHQDKALRPDSGSQQRFLQDKRASCTLGKYGPGQEAFIYHMLVLKLDTIHTWEYLRSTSLTSIGNAGHKITLVIAECAFDRFIQFVSQAN